MTTPEEREEEFVDWCKNKDGRDDACIKQMLSILRGSRDTFGPISDYFPGCNSAFECDSAEVAQHAYEKAMLSVANSKSHNQLSSAFGKYRDFLSQDADEPLHFGDRALQPFSFDIPETEEIGDPYTDEDFLEEVFIDSDSLRKLKSLLERKKNLILQGAPGTGKTYAAKRLAYAFMGVQDDSRIELVQFNQNTMYDDFVFGYRPSVDGSFVPVNGSFIDFCDIARGDTGRSYFLIIDEINRANISKVFGELLMLIEADHRNEEVRLTASGDMFSIPPNLYIIGMMNTADRGLALIDYALRRRFAFFEMQPALTNEKFVSEMQAKGSEKLMALINQTVVLNAAIEEDAALGRGFRIGHSYFCVDSPTDEVVESILEFELAPLIDEYWFDNQERAESEKSKLKNAIR